jgi:site-specific recombinase XerD
MKISNLIIRYIEYRQSLGEKFRTNSTYLKAFSKSVGLQKNVKAISSKEISSFLYGTGPVTSAWFAKYTALAGFYQYAVSRGFLDRSPMPLELPKKPPAFLPYIYSRAELKLLFETALTYQKNKSYVQPFMVRMLLLMLYSTGLRLHETLSLTMGNISLSELTIKVEETKFYKSRLVPFGDQLAKEIEAYLNWRKKQKMPQDQSAPFFYGRNNKSLNSGTVEEIFLRIRKKAGIKRGDNARYQPRLHDLRHTFAVHRLMSWYQENADVQQLLPVLSVYMGHTYLSATSVYLTMTKDLLQEASKRFENYARRNNVEQT